MPYRFLYFILFSAFIFVFSLKAHATFISPGRIIIEANQNATTVRIINRSDQAYIYTFDWERRVQSPDSPKSRVLKEDDVPPPGYIPADEYLIYSPRQVLVEPRGQQVVRLLARRPADMPAGEARSNLLVKPRPVEVVNDRRVGPNQFGGGVRVIPQASVPVYLRTGQTFIDVNHENIQIFNKDGQPHISYTIVNNSTEHVFMAHDLVCERSGQDDIVGRIHVQRLYPEAKRLNIERAVPQAIPDPNSCEGLKLNLAEVKGRSATVPYKTITIR